MHFVKESRIQAPASVVFAFHERPDALAKLTPPWQQTEIVKPPSSLAVGTQVVLRTKIGPFWQTMEAVHVAYEPGRMFADRLVRGPFRSWLHQHVIEPEGPSTCVLRDEIDYELPFGAVGRVLGAPFARAQLERLFAYRHEVTRSACEGGAAA